MLLAASQSVFANGGAFRNTGYRISKPDPPPRPQSTTPPPSGQDLKKPPPKPGDGGILSQPASGGKEIAGSFIFGGSKKRITVPRVGFGRMRSGASYYEVSDNELPQAVAVVLEQQASGGFSPVDHQSKVFLSGDRMKISLASNTGGYFYLINRDSTGNRKVVFPDRSASSNSNCLSPGESATFPEDGSLVFDDKVGTEIFEVYLSRVPVPRYEESIRLKTNLAPLTVLPTYSGRGIKILESELIPGSKSTVTKEYVRIESNVPTVREFPSDGVIGAMFVVSHSPR